MSETKVGRITHLGIVAGLPAIDVRVPMPRVRPPKSADRLTPEERATVSRAKVAARAEVDSLVRIIERLAGEVVVPADEGG